MNVEELPAGIMMADVPTPALVIDLGRLQHNIHRMAELASEAGVALRPHWKTSKSLHIASLQAAAGAVGFTCATAREARVLVSAGYDVFWAYPPVGDARVEAVIDLTRRGRLMVGLDSVESARALSRAAVDGGVEVTVRLDIDTGLGRTGATPNEAPAVLEQIAGLDGLRIDGIFTHEGQLAAHGTDRVARRAAGRAVGELMAAVAENARTRGAVLTTVSVGSTPGADSAPMVDGITEMRPGTYVFGDDNQRFTGAVDDDECALTVHSTVVSVQRGETVIVDAGIKAMSSDGSARKDGRIGTRLDGPGILATGHEEHGFLRGAADVRLGDRIVVLPNHACGTVNMFSSAWVVREGRVVDQWPIEARR